MNHPYRWEERRFFKNHRKGKSGGRAGGQNFPVENEGVIHRRGSSVEVESKNCFSLVMHGFCSNNALYSGSF